MALIEHGHGTLLFFQLRTSILTRLMRPGFARRPARESCGQLNVKSPHPNVGWKDGAGCHCAVAAHGHMVALLRRSPAQFCDGHGQGRWDVRTGLDPRLHRTRARPHAGTPLRSFQVMVTCTSIEVPGAQKPIQPHFLQPLASSFFCLKTQLFFFFACFKSTHFPRRRSGISYPNPTFLPLCRKLFLFKQQLCFKWPRYKQIKFNKT